MSRRPSWARDGTRFKDLSEDHPAKTKGRATARARYYRRKAEGKPLQGVKSISQLRDAALKQKYGITEAAYQQMHDAQRGVCAICQSPETRSSSKSGRPKRLAVDHDHQTLQIRGLLCHDCNIALGLFHDELSRLHSAIRYLKK